MDGIISDPNPMEHLYASARGNSPRTPYQVPLGPQTAVPQTPVLSAEQFLLITLVVKLAVVAMLATMLVRFPWFRRILLTEKRDWPERLVFAAGFGVPLTPASLRASPPQLRRRRPHALRRVPGRTHRRPLRRRASSAPWSGSRRSAAGEWIALPFAMGCGFAGGGLREVCPKEAIWHFSPLFFTGLHRHVWQLVRRFQIDWVVLLLAAPIRLELLRQSLGHRFGTIVSSPMSRRTTCGIDVAAGRPGDGSRASPSRSRSGTARASSTGCRSRRSC